VRPQPYNLSKIARRDPPSAFDVFSPERRDPYRLNKGKPGSEDTVDKLRAGNQGTSNSIPGGGASQFENGPAWPSDSTILDDSEGRPKRDNGRGIVTDHGLELHDDGEIGEGDSSDATLGINQTTSRQLDDNHRDRPPSNVNSYNGNGVLQGLKQRLRNI